MRKVRFFIWEGFNLNVRIPEKISLDLRPRKVIYLKGADQFYIFWICIVGSRLLRRRAILELANSYSRYTSGRNDEKSYLLIIDNQGFDPMSDVLVIRNI